jgi:hypothetical protein
VDDPGTEKLKRERHKVMDVNYLHTEKERNEKVKNENEMVIAKEKKKEK